jgi:hypothetical protein
MGTLTSTAPAATTTTEVKADVDDGGNLDVAVHLEVGVDDNRVALAGLPISQTRAP